MKTVVIICNDVVGSKMAGPAIRCVEVGKVLARRFRVVLISPQIDSAVQLPFQAIQSSDVASKEIALGADVVIFQGDGLRTHAYLRDFKGLLIADLYCPIPLEYHQVSDSIALDVRSSTLAYLSTILLEQLCFADHFLCASERQREFWFGALTLAARINAHRWPVANQANIDDLITLLPFGLDSKRPVLERRALRNEFNIPADEFVMVWGGGIYEWFDPLTIIRAIDQLVKEGHKVHLVFFGVKHPNPGISEHGRCREAVTLAEQLGLKDRFVHFNFGWVDYKDRHNFLLDADIGVSAHFDNPETRYSFRTRMLDYLWCGLPIVATKGDYFGDNLEPRGVGISVNYQDTEGWVAAIRRVMENRDFVRSCRDNAQAWSRSFEWENVADGLLRICEEGSLAKDRTFVRDWYSSLNSNRRPSLSKRLRHVYTTGGLKSVFSVAFRKVRRAVY